MHKQRAAMGAEHENDSNRGKDTLTRRGVLTILGVGALALATGCSSENNQPYSDNSLRGEKPADQPETGQGVSPEALEAAQKTVTKQAIVSSQLVMDSIEALIAAGYQANIHNDSNGQYIGLDINIKSGDGHSWVSIGFNHDRNQVSYRMGQIIERGNETQTTSFHNTFQLNEDSLIKPSSTDTESVIEAFRGVFSLPSASIIDAGVQKGWRPDKADDGSSCGIAINDKGMIIYEGAEPSPQSERAMNDAEAHNAASRYCEIASSAHNYLEKVI